MIFVYCKFLYPTTSSQILPPPSNLLVCLLVVVNWRDIFRHRGLSTATIMVTLRRCSFVFLSWLIGGTPSGTEASRLELVGLPRAPRIDTSFVCILFQHGTSWEPERSGIIRVQPILWLFASIAMSLRYNCVVVAM